MNMLLREPVTDAAIGVAVADRPEDLSAIHHHGCAAVIWRREPLPDFQSWIDALPRQQLPRARVILRPEHVHDAVEHIFATADIPDCKERTMLVDDTAAQASIFARLLGAPFLRLRFDVITDNACRKFHIDSVKARLVCTYRGTGTQYCNATGGEEPQQVFTVPTASPIVLRGTLWPAESKSGVLHRSPPIEGTGETRLLLVLDPIFDPEGQPDRKHMH
ncbi:MAG: DUF1826 domain-containing protein [Pseudomonadota bacterium]